MKHSCGPICGLVSPPGFVLFPMADTDTTPTEDLVTMCRAAVRPRPPFDPTRMLDPIAAGANVMAIDGWCFPAWLAAKGLEPDVLAAILAAPGVDINAADEFGRTRHPDRRDGSGPAWNPEPF